MEKLSILDRLDRELLGKGDWGSSVKDPNDRDRPVPELGDLGKSSVPETGEPSMEVSGHSAAVTTVGVIVKGSKGQLGGDQTLGERGGLSEEPKWLDLTARWLEMPIFEGWNPEGWIYHAERYFYLNKLSAPDKWRRRLSVSTVKLWHGFSGRTIVVPFGESTVREYRRVFESLASPSLKLPEHVMESTFINGLLPDIRAEVRMLKPEGLARIMEFAQRVEDRNLSLRPSRCGYRASG
ncbi:hypothetical protein TIFTF001_003189 [Ficus carica]|uniref:Uncharacterized protein n=1 Tax=Ficus carica TaxID=3494 RepID=A0AA87ZA83_FICCA|nr:hypothetical protein TIFTF001_003189 [Ficus carica]